MRLSNWLDWQVIVTALFIAAVAAVGMSSSSDYVIQILVLATIYAAVAASWSPSDDAMLSAVLTFWFIGRVWDKK